MSLDNPQLPVKEQKLLSDILNEWKSYTTMTNLLSHWTTIRHTPTVNQSLTLQLLCFNVRGFDQRWHEVCLLSKTYKSDIIILNEVGKVEIGFVETCFAAHNVYYQAGENSHGGVLIMIRNNLRAARVKFNTPNVCAIDLMIG